MRQAKNMRFTVSDGTRLFYRYWPGETSDTTGDTTGAIVLFHRGHEHSGRIQHVVDELDLPGYAMFAWDARGHGLSFRPEDRSNPSLGTFTKDRSEERRVGKV